MRPFRPLNACLATLVVAAAMPFSAGAGPQKGGTLNVGLYSQPVSLDPAGSSGDAGSQAVMYSVFDPARGY